MQMFLVLALTSFLANQIFLIHPKPGEKDINLQYFDASKTRAANHTFPSLLDPSSQPNKTLCAVTANWANQPHFRNANPGSLYMDAAVTKNALSIAHDLLGQTLCHEQGRLRTTSSENWNMSNLSLLKDWEFKLIYLAIHDFHHRPAREEYQERTNCPQAFPATGFQCSSSRFLVTSILNLGVGAAVRLGAVSHVLSAIATDRVPVFVANAGAGPDFLQDPWRLASCDRKDLQCVFLPTTPCTLLDTDLNDAAVVAEDSAAVSILLKGKVPDDLNSHRVLVLRSRAFGAKRNTDTDFHKEIRERIYVRAVKLIDEWIASESSHDIDEPKLNFLQEAAKRILQRDDAPTDPHYNYGHRHYRIPHAILLYLLRPNQKAKAVIDKHMGDIFKRPVTPETTIGLPIRGSDKCGKESTCLHFEKYMRLAKETWESSAVATSGIKRGSLIMTTEDEDVFRERVLYNATSGFPLDFIVNENDSLQGSGNVKVFGLNADEIMLSSLIAIRMQLNAGRVFGNCCSNFHMMLFDFVREGCGLTSEAICLQETEDYKVCCSWDKHDGECEQENTKAHKKGLRNVNF